LIYIIDDLGESKVMHKLNCATGCYLFALFCLLSFKHFPYRMWLL